MTTGNWQFLPVIWVSSGRALSTLTKWKPSARWQDNHCLNKCFFRNSRLFLNFFKRFSVIVYNGSPFKWTITNRKFLEFVFYISYFWAGIFWKRVAVEESTEIRQTVFRRSSNYQTKTARKETKMDGWCNKTQQGKYIRGRRQSKYASFYWETLI